MIEWAITSSVLILVVTALRRVLMGKISLRVQYGLWALVLVRLLLPVSLGETAWSVLNLTQPVLDGEGHAAVSWPGEADRVTPELPTVIPKDETDPQLSIVEPDTSSTQKLPQVDSAASEVPERADKVERGLTVLWATGAVGLGLWFLWVNVRFAGKLRRSRRPLSVETCSLPVYVAGVAQTPCLFGGLHPCIYVTEEVAANETILRHSLAHELTHYHHKDHLWAVLRGLCLALHWYNPLVWLAAALSRRDGELCCDEATVRSLGEGERAAYGRTLLAVTCQGRGNSLLAATSMTGCGKGIRERIVLLAKHPRTAVYTLVAVLLIAAAAVGCTFTGAEQEEKTVPNQVEMVQVLSSFLPPEPVTDPETVTHLWELYQGFTFEGTAEGLDQDNVWSITVDFSWENSQRTERFTIFQGGLCTLGEDYETYHVLKDGAELYQEFETVFDRQMELSGEEDNPNGTAASAGLDENFYLLLSDWYDARYSGERWYFQGNQPGQPQEGDILLGPVDYQGGEVYLNESTGEVCVVEVSRYEEGQFRALPDPHTLVLHRGQDGSFQGVLGALERDTGAMTAEDIVLNVALGLLDADVSLRRDGYPLPVGPGTWTWEELFHPVYDGEPEVQTLPDYEPIYAEGDRWERWSVEGFSALYYCADQEDRWSANTIDVTRADLFTPRGVRVGDSREQVLAAYPEALTGDYWGQYPEEPDLLAYVAWNPHAPGEISDLSQLEFYEGLGPAILFFFEGDTLRQITLTNMFN